jgi:hypothetical protein
MAMQRARRPSGNASAPSPHPASHTIQKQSAHAAALQDVVSVTEAAAIKKKNACAGAQPGVPAPLPVLPVRPLLPSSLQQ